MTAGSAPTEIWREDFTPYFFGEGPRRLYACHHRPASMAPASAPAVLLCQATGHEYERSHRTMRQLAQQLAKSGHHALRFDYRGTGDSAGEYAQAGLAQWRQDVSVAIDECKRVAERRQVGIVGLRLGAMLAAQAAAQREDVESLVLYAPIADGRSLLDEWEHAHLEHERKHGLAGARQRGSGEILGFPLSDVLRAEIETLDLPPPNPALRRVLILAEQPGDRGVQRFAQTLASRNASVHVEPAEAPAIWRREPFEAIVPFKLLRRIITWMKEGGR
jgi:alpha/beta superfamily hydrolase